MSVNWKWNIYVFFISLIKSIQFCFRDYFRLNYCLKIKKLYLKIPWNISDILEQPSRDCVCTSNKILSVILCCTLLDCQIRKTFKHEQVDQLNIQVVLIIIWIPCKNTIFKTDCRKMFTSWWWWWCYFRTFCYIYQPFQT